MQEKRRRNRMIPPDFRDFNVQIKQADLTMIGSLGNISSDGMLALIPGEIDPPVEKDTIFDGLIRSRRLSEDLTFRARKVWSEVRTVQNTPYHLIGMQFTEDISLPDTLIAFELAAEIID